MAAIKVCPRCGRENKDEHSFCDECRERLSGEDHREDLASSDGHAEDTDQTDQPSADRPAGGPAGASDPDPETVQPTAAAGTQSASGKTEQHVGDVLVTRGEVRIDQRVIINPLIEFTCSVCYKMQTGARWQCPSCGRIVCAECWVKAFTRCEECLKARDEAPTAEVEPPPSVPALPLLVVPAGRAILTFDTSDMKMLTAMPLPHSIRCVSVAEYEGQRTLLCGWRQGIYVADPLEGTLVAEHSVPGGESRRGFNCAVVKGRHLYAAHRDYGLCRWNLETSDCETDLWADEVRPEGEYLSCLRVSPSGDLWFAAGGKIVQQCNDERQPLIYQGFSEEIWYLATSDDLVAASSGVCEQPAKAGNWAIWELHRAEQPVMRGETPRAAAIARVDTGGQRSIVLVSQEGTIHVLDENRRWLDVGHVNLPQIRTAAVAGPYLAIAGRASGEGNTRIVIWNCASNQVATDIAGKQDCLVVPSKLTSLAALTAPV